MAKVIISGIAGFIGSHLADALLAEGHEICGIDDLSRGRRSNIPKDAEFYGADIRDYVKISQIISRFKPDYIYHLAALARVRPSIQNPMGYHTVNVNGTLNLLEIARTAGIKFIFASSSSVFGGSPTPWSENTTKRPLNPYALQKFQAEQYIKLYHNLYGLNYCILRYFNIYGPRQIIGGAYATVMGIFLDQRAKGNSLTIFGDGKQRRDFTHIKDAVRASLLAMNHTGDFNIGRGKNMSVQEIADLISDKQVYLDPPPGEARETLCDNAKAREIMGWNPTIDINEEILEEMEKPL